MSIFKKSKSSKALLNGSETKTPEIEKYPLDHDDYTIIGIIGKGAFAKVYGAECKSKNKSKVAIKVIKLEHEDDYGDNNDVKPLQISDIQQEAAIMSSLRHENIVSCFASFVVRDELWMVMPFISGGSTSYILSHSINNFYSKGIKDEAVLCCILRDTLFGLKYMHNQGRIHRDIKGRNILIDGQKGTAMLADFGVSGALLEGGLKKRGRNTMTGTPCWMAPEVMKHQRYNHKADIWSLGITALELAFATTPYTKLKSPMKVMMEIMDGKPPTVDSMEKNSKFSKSFKNFVAKCVIKDPNKRLSAQELLATAFIKTYSKDRDFMIKNFVKHISKIRIKQCQEHDLPSSRQQQTIKLLKKKSTKYKMTVDDEDGINDDDNNEHDFNFSTSLRMDKDDVDEMNQEIENRQQQNLHIQQKSTKKGKFTVTPIEDNKTNNNQQTETKKKSRFQVTQAE